MKRFIDKEKKTIYPMDRRSMEGSLKMTLSIREIKKLVHKEKKYTGHKFGGGLYLIIEPQKNKYKHFVGLTKYPKGIQKTISVPLGVFEKDIKTKEALKNLSSLLSLRLNQYV